MIGVTMVTVIVATPTEIVKRTSLNGLQRGLPVGETPSNCMDSKRKSAGL